MRLGGLPGGLRRRRGDPGPLRPRGPGDDQESALATLVEAASTGAARPRCWSQTALYLGIGIADLINLFNPERVILGGWAGLLLGERMLPDDPRGCAQARAAASVRDDLDRAVPPRPGRRGPRRRDAAGRAVPRGAAPMAAESRSAG